MIKTLSPHYKNIPWLSPSSGTVPNKYILNIYIWSGYKANVPLTPTYEIENVNPLGRSGSVDIDVSKYVNEFFDINLITNTTTSINDANSLLWVKTEVIYYISDVAQSPEFEEIDSAVKGYGYGMEGSNPTTPTNNYLATTVEQKVSKNGVYLCSFLASETESTVIKVNDLTFTKLSSTHSEDIIQVIYVKVDEFEEDYIEIYKDDVLMTTLLVTEEPAYEPLDIVFINKEGQLQTITFFKEITDTLNVTRENYESSNGQPINGVHQFKNYNVNGRESFSVNSGFVKEDNNEIFTQLLLSEKVWNLKNNVYIPLNVGSETIEYKTRKRDRLINYKIDFKYSFNKINRI